MVVGSSSSVVSDFAMVLLYSMGNHYHHVYRVCVLSGQGNGKITFHMTGFVPPIEYSTQVILYRLMLLFICDAHVQRGLKVFRLLQRNKHSHLFRDNVSTNTT